MTALVCAAPGELKLETRPRPPSSADGVLVRPRRIGICGTDYHIFEGKHPFLQYPRIMGHELAVEVVEPGNSDLAERTICVVNPYLSCGTCHACSRGKPNCCTRISVLGVHQDGGMQELIVLPAANLLPAPGLSIDGCATVEFLAIGAHAVRRGGVSSADTVLVIGGGPIGLGAALFAKLAGAAKVAIIDRDGERSRSTAAIAGIDSVPLDDGLDKSLSNYTSGNGFDVVFDATGNQASMQRGFDFVAHGGRYVLVSVVKDQITFSDPDFHRRELTLFGSRNATSEDFARVISAIRDGKVPLDRIITHRTSLADAARDLPVWAHEKQGLIKAMIEIGG
ncbi:zinc-binding alcohol dehydrogenase family protein [Aestuariivirga sp.]|uniref:zinc-binding alcohol dehydrogenase family protein n=1 Tax=Aestuariivirga sp. TaxID=2650926 RepID=UPI0039E5E0E4